MAKKLTQAEIIAKMKHTKVYFDYFGIAVSIDNATVDSEDYFVLPASYNPIGHARSVIEAAQTKEIARRLQEREKRQAKDVAMRSIGMKRVKGNLGGTYWE